MAIGAHRIRRIPAFSAVPPQTDDTYSPMSWPVRDEPGYDHLSGFIGGRRR